jgi:peptide/nickel transport system substrate-binding protein
MISRRHFLVASAAITASSPLGADAAATQVLRIGMTAADIPTVTGLPNNGGEGARFLGYPVYDAVVNWDYTHPNEIALPTAGLFTAWRVAPNDPTRWLFTVRRNVTYHDGSAFRADDIIWNLDRVYNDKSPQYDAPSAPTVRAPVSMLDQYEKLDDDTIAITTKYPYAFFPHVLTRFMIASPTQWEKVGRSWQAFAKAPSGTGPFRITKHVPNQYVEMSRFEGYWNPSRIPKLDSLVVYPMPEATTRLAALRSGQVDWIEVPPPDAIPSLKAAGFQISLWPYPHTYPYVLKCTPDSPFADRRVRQAINYAIDREGMCRMLNGTAKPAGGFYPEDSPLFGKPENRYDFDPERAKALLKAAGYGPDRHVKAKIMISTSGSGQMVPIPMNELLQQNFQAVGIDIGFDVVEWGTMIVAMRSAPDAPQSHGVDGVNNSLGYVDPSTMFRYFCSDAFSPVNQNWGHFSTPATDDLLRRAMRTFDAEQQTELIAQAHARVVDEAPWLFIVHDLNPRAMSPKVRGFQPAQSWSQDFTHITMVNPA